MFDHVEIHVADFPKSLRFYEQALAPLGIRLQWAGDDIAGFGTGAVVGADGQERTEFLIQAGKAQTPKLHLAFRAPSREAVEGFHRGALAAGGVDNGGPGLRSDYHAGYYAAFALDPDGHNIEAVLHEKGAAET